MWFSWKKMSKLNKMGNAHESSVVLAYLKFYVKDMKEIKNLVMGW